MKIKPFHILIAIAAVGCSSRAGNTETVADSSAVALASSESAVPPASSSTPAPEDNFPDYSAELLSDDAFEDEVTSGIGELVNLCNNQTLFTFISSYTREREVEGEYEAGTETEEVKETWFYDEAFTLKAFSRKYFRSGEGRDTKFSLYLFSGDSLVAMSEWWSEDGQIGMNHQRKILTSKCPRCGVRVSREAGSSGVVTEYFSPEDIDAVKDEVVRSMSELINPEDEGWKMEVAGLYTMTEEISEWKVGDSPGFPYNVTYTTNQELFDYVSFSKLVNLFYSRGAQIPKPVAGFLDTDANNGSKAFSAVQMLEDEKIYFALYNVTTMVGGGLDELYAVTMSKQGEIIDGKLLGSAFPSSGPGGDGEDFSYSYDSDKHILTVTNTRIQFDEQSQREVSTDEVNKFKMDASGRIVGI